MIRFIGIAIGIANILIGLYVAVCGAWLAGILCFAISIPFLAHTLPRRKEAKKCKEVRK